MDHQQNPICNKTNTHGKCCIAYKFEVHNFNEYLYSNLSTKHFSLNASPLKPTMKLSKLCSSKLYVGFTRQSFSQSNFYTRQKLKTCMLHVCIQDCNIHYKLSNIKYTDYYSCSFRVHNIIIILAINTNIL